MLAVRGLSKSFGGLTAVRDLDFEIGRGSVTALIGPNGAGKSTVFNLVSGALRPDAGTVRFGDVDVTGTPAHRLARIGIARSFQITNLFPRFTVRQNLKLARLSLEPRRAFLRLAESFAGVEDDVDSLLATYGLDQQATTVAHDLSHGDQRRLEVAISMASKPSLLMLDEPTQGMGPLETSEFKELIRNIRGTTSILLVEHDVDLVLGTCDHVIVLQQGAKIAEGPPADIRSDAAVRDAYLGGEA